MTDSNVAAFRATLAGSGDAAAVAVGPTYRRALARIRATSTERASERADDMAAAVEADRRRMAKLAGHDLPDTDPMAAEREASARFRAAESAPDQLAAATDEYIARLRRRNRAA